MFFEERSTKILCRRVIYVSGANNKNETVVSFDKYSRPIPDEVRAKLTEEELVALQAWLDKRDQKTDTILDRMALDGLAGTLRRSIKALEVPENVAKLTEDKTAELWAELDEMRRALRKAGRPKPKDEAKAKAG